MTDGSFPPPPGFQPPPAPGGYVGAPSSGGYPPPPPPRKGSNGWLIGCGGGCLLLLVMLVVGVFFIKPLFLMMLGWIGIAGLSALSSGAVVWHATSPDGARLAELRRTGLGSAQLAYSLTVTPVDGGDRCTAAYVFGDRAETYVHVQWVGPTALSVSYGQPRSGSAFQAPTINTATRACSGITVTPLHDPSLDALAEAMNNGGDADVPPPPSDGDAGGKPGADAPPSDGDQTGGGK